MACVRSKCCYKGHFDRKAMKNTLGRHRNWRQKIVMVVELKKVYQSVTKIKGRLVGQNALKFRLSPAVVLFNACSCMHHVLIQKLFSFRHLPLCRQ